MKNKQKRTTPPTSEQETLLLSWQLFKSINDVSKKHLVLCGASLR